MRLGLMHGMGRLGVMAAASHRATAARCRVEGRLEIAEACLLAAERVLDQELARAGEWPDGIIGCVVEQDPVEPVGLDDVARDAVAGRHRERTPLKSRLVMYTPTWTSPLMLLPALPATRLSLRSCCSRHRGRPRRCLGVGGHGDPRLGAVGRELGLALGREDLAVDPRADECCPRRGSSASRRKRSRRRRCRWPRGRCQGR